MDRPLKGHWGLRTDDDFLYQVAFDFVAQLEEVMKEEDIDRAKLARKLGVSKGRVSQILNDPTKLRLENVVRCARVLDLKVSIVAYKDPRRAIDDSGPVAPQVFVKCWERGNKPTDLFQVERLFASTSDRIDQRYSSNGLQYWDGRLDSWEDDENDVVDPWAGKDVVLPKSGAQNGRTNTAHV